MYELPEPPPRYVAFWAVHPAEGGGGETTLADAHELLRHFTADDIDQLHRTAYTWRSRPTLASEGIDLGCVQTVLTATDEGTIVRFSSRTWPKPTT